MYRAGAGATSFCLEPEPTQVGRVPESAPGPWSSGAGAAQKSGGSATLFFSSWIWIRETLPLCGPKSLNIINQLINVRSVRCLLLPLSVFTGLF